MDCVIVFQEALLLKKATQPCSLEITLNSIALEKGGASGWMSFCWMYSVYSICSMTFYLPLCNVGRVWTTDLGLIPYIHPNTGCISSMWHCSFIYRSPFKGVNWKEEKLQIAFRVLLLILQTHTFAYNWVLIFPTAMDFLEFWQG